MVTYRQIENYIVHTIKWYHNKHRYTTVSQPKNKKELAIMGHWLVVVQGNNEGIVEGHTADVTSSNANALYTTMCRIIIINIECDSNLYYGQFKFDTPNPNLLLPPYLTHTTFHLLLNFLSFKCLSVAVLNTLKFW